MFLNVAQNWIPNEAKKGLGYRVKRYPKLGSITLPFVSACVWLQLLVTPCMPMNLGYMWYSECSNSENLDKILLHKIFHYSSATLYAWVYIFGVECF